MSKAQPRRRDTHVPGDTRDSGPEADSRLLS